MMKALSAAADMTLNCWTAYIALTVVKILIIVKIVASSRTVAVENLTLREYVTKKYFVVNFYCVHPQHHVFMA